NIRDNALLYRKRLAEFDTTLVERLATYVLTRTYLVVVATQDLDYAFRMFSVLNERGLDLRNSDLIKAQILGRVPSDEQDSYSDRWEESEEELGRDNFDELLAHIRTIHLKRRPQRTIVQEFREDVIANYPDQRQLIDGVILPYARIFDAIRSEEFQSTS